MVREVIRKVVRVSVAEHELFTHESFERFEYARSDPTQFHTTPPQNLPFQVRHIGNEHFIDNVDRRYCCEEMGEKLVIGGGVFPLQKRRRTQQCRSCHPRKARRRG
jgi:hypothetical protein